ncbi:ParB/RepB/Spo0J family partition protein [Pseudonocardia sp. WMMC193]|uniref:ParB/RepB/Spo0J family partition protein n=1 Tax=Pseudonocardia sp. WMMC193 TaxID=2911965 RepID=UPI001F3EFA40|nr:ParB/RepB/Spo0J family partition protein [Pseudonocardia sp. WMMC193]MCF7547320.1 ParB/RepB/Spo0J family partition protein [Pseudonocardia sp. WMMC193]
MSTTRTNTTAADTRPAAPVAEPRDFPRKTALVSCGRLAMHPRNIRTTLTDLDELAASIRAEGVLQPLLAHSRFERADGVADLEVIDGHRRLAAAEIAGLLRVPVIVRPQLTDDDALFAMLAAALKADVTDRDKAKAVTSLNEEFDYTWTEIATRLKLPLTTVQGWRQGRARPRAAKTGPGRSNAGARAPRIKPSAVHEMCARFDRHELTADEVIAQLRDLLGGWHPALGTTVHNEKPTQTATPIPTATSTEVPS